jgi:Flp pilus assembly protein TadB
MSLSPDSKNFLAGLLIGHAASRRDADGKTLADRQAERYAAMAPAEHQRQINREGGFWAIAMLFVVFPGAACLIPIVLFAAVVLLFFALFSVVSAAAPLFWLAGFLAPLWLFTAL